MCDHDVYFEDPLNTTRTIAGNGDSVVSIRPKCYGKGATATEFMQGYNVRIQQNMVLEIDGENHFSLCDWVSPGRYFYFLYGGESAKVRTLHFTAPER